MKKNIVSILMLMVSLTAAASFAAPAATPAKPAQKAAAAQSQVQYIKTSSLDIVNNPTKYLNKQVEFTGKFDKFSTLGLDYNKAMRDSAKFIGFLIQRDDVKDHNIPLSELKMFMKRDYAEKFIDLNTGDSIKVKGKVFSDALGDGWLDIATVEVLQKAPAEK